VPEIANYKPFFKDPEEPKKEEPKKEEPKKDPDADMDDDEKKAKAEFIKNRKLKKEAEEAEK